MKFHPITILAQTLLIQLSLWLILILRFIKRLKKVHMWLKMIGDLQKILDSNQSIANIHLCLIIRFQLLSHRTQMNFIINPKSLRANLLTINKKHKPLILLIPTICLYLPIQNHHQIRYKRICTQSQMRIYILPYTNLSKPLNQR